MTTVLRTAGAFVLATLGVALLRAQQPAGSQSDSPPPTGLIVGRTIDGSTGKPVGGAIVTLGTAGAAIAPGAPPVAPATLARFPIRVISDGAGHFVFHDLPKSSFTLSASKPGYADTNFGRRTPTDTGVQLLTLGDAEKRGDILMSLWKHASISGTVVDEAGEPLIGIQLRILKRAVVGGRVRFTQLGSMPSTDDRGMYRAASLTPGDYVVAIVTTQAAMPTSWQEAYYAASKGGTFADLLREFDRSGSGPLGVNGAVGGGQRVGSWILQTPLGFGSARDVTAPPVSGGKVYVYPTVFFSAASAASKATIVTLGSGEDRSAIDFQLKPVAASTVSGTLTGPDGPESHTALALLPASADELQRDYDAAAATTITDAAGNFVFLGVPSGAYTIRALKVPRRPVAPPSSGTVIQTGSGTIFSGGGAGPAPVIPNDPTLWATTTVSVEDKDVSGIALTFRVGARITGQLKFDGAAEMPTADRLTGVSVTIDQADARMTSGNQFMLSRGVVDTAGQFKTYQFPPGRYTVRAAGPLPGWTFKSATFNGRDVSDAPLDLGAEDVNGVVVTFTDRPAELSGTARDSAGPDATATVLIFPAQPSLWADQGPAPRRLRSVRAGTDGTYRLPNLPTGDYLVVAVRSAVPADWMDPKFLQRAAPVATRVTIGDGDKTTQDLQAKEIR